MVINKTILSSVARRYIIWQRGELRRVIPALIITPILPQLFGPTISLSHTFILSTALVNFVLRPTSFLFRRLSLLVCISRLYITAAVNVHVQDAMRRRRRLINVPRSLFAAVLHDVCVNKWWKTPAMPVIYSRNASINNVCNIYFVYLFIYLLRLFNISKEIYSLAGRVRRE